MMKENVSSFPEQFDIIAPTPEGGQKIKISPYDLSVFSNEGGALDINEVYINKYVKISLAGGFVGISYNGSEEIQLLPVSDIELALGKYGLKILLDELSKVKTESRFESVLNNFSEIYGLLPSGSSLTEQVRFDEYERAHLELDSLSLFDSDVCNYPGNNTLSREELKKLDIKVKTENLPSLSDRIAEGKAFREAKHYKNK